MPEIENKEEKAGRRPGKCPYKGKELIEYIEKYIDECDGNYTFLSELTNISRSTLTRTVKGSPELMERFKESFENMVGRTERRLRDIIFEKDGLGNSTKNAMLATMFFLKTRKREVYGQEYAAPVEPPPALVIMSPDEARKAFKEGKLKGIDTSILEEK